MQNKYLNHAKTVGEELDLTVTACFLSLPIVSLLWSILSFTVAVAAFSIQQPDDNLGGEVLLSVILGVAVLCGCGILFFFWQIWGDPREDEVEDRGGLSFNVGFPADAASENKRSTVRAKITGYRQALQRAGWR